MTQREAHSTREEHHSVGTRVLLLGCTTAVILINTRVLGATGQGEIAWIQLGVLLVTGISGFLAGGAVVYLQKEIPLRAMLMPGHIWLVLAAILGTLIGAASGFLPTEHIAAIALLGWLQGMIIFHSQLLLAHHQIKRHNLLQSTQGGTLLLALALAFFAFNHPSVDSFLVSLGLSLGITAGLSVWWLRRLPFGRGEMRPKEVVQRLWRYGRSAQTGALLQMLTNRANFSILARSQAGLAASGIYSIAYYGLEAMWLVPRALAPLVYTRAAAADSKQQRMHSTTNALWKALLGTLALLIPAVLIPDTWYEWAFGFDGIQPVIWSLAPAAVCGAVASIVAHHLSGIGQHRWNAWTSGLGLVTLAWLAQLWVPDYGAIGAAWAASGAAVVQTTGLMLAWWNCEKSVD